MKIFRPTRFFWITCSGLLWMAVGVFLLMIGVRFIAQEALLNPVPSVIMQTLFQIGGGKEPGAFLLIVLALFVGFFKGRFVLSKTVKKVVMRIAHLEEPIALKSVYNARYLLLIALMVSFSMMIKFFHVPLDIRGFIDVAIGSALINGASFYFRALYALKKSS